MLVVKISENERTERESVLEDLRRAKNKDGWEKEPAYVNELKSKVPDNKIEGTDFTLHLDMKPFKCEEIIHIQLKNKDAIRDIALDNLVTGLKGLLEDVIKNDLASFVGMSKKSENTMDFYSVNELVKVTPSEYLIPLVTSISNTRDIRTCDVTCSIGGTEALKFCYDMEIESISYIIVLADYAQLECLVDYGRMK